MSTRIGYGIAICLGLLIGGGFAAAAESQISTMSFNIRYGTAKDADNHWDKRRDQVIEMIKKHDPDILGLQEALRFQIDYIREKLPQYAEIGIGREGGTAGEYSGILYKKERFSVDESGTFWMSDTPDKPTITWGNACLRICTWARLVDKKNKSGIYAYNTHWDHKSRPSRDKSAALTAKMIAQRKHQDPFFLAGDFNSAEKSTAIRYLTENPDSPVSMKDAFRILHPDATDVGTFCGFGRRKPVNKIDYIFVSPGIKVLKAEIDGSKIDGRFPSDHFPVTAILTISSSK